MTSTSDAPSKLGQRVEAAATAALQHQRHVTPIDVLIGIGWLTWPAVERWQQGRAPTLAQVLQVDEDRALRALEYLEGWASGAGLRSDEIPYVTTTRSRTPLRFTEDGDAETERRFRTYWIDGELPDGQHRKIVQERSTPPDLVVISTVRDWTCAECGGTGDLLVMEGDSSLCMTCADLDHLVFLPAGNAALTRRAKKASTLCAVVVRSSRSRRRYERQGLLVEEAALRLAEEQCLADEDVRQRRRERDEARREARDESFQAAFADALLALFPGCPPARAEAIARHAAVRGSGRVGRSAAGQALDPKAVTLAVAASVRHDDTIYDELLMAGAPRREARVAVHDAIERVLDAWRDGSTDPEDDEARRVARSRGWDRPHPS